MLCKKRNTSFPDWQTDLDVARRIIIESAEKYSEYLETQKRYQKQKRNKKSAQAELDLEDPSDILDLDTGAQPTLTTAIDSIDQD
ncbi:MAG: hypothetical protein K2X90_03785 [Candidatus Babeliaceae bacterium]|nr:hypothetical protein [Candidatus Babeliaceae bacterium]